MDGYEASRQIRQLEANIPNLSTPVVIIALTATAFDEERTAILEAGCNDFVRKPFKGEVIFDMMQRYLDVEYVYEDLKPLLAPNTFVASFDAQKLKREIQKMPKSWVNQLHQGALGARETRISHLIEQIPQEQTYLSEFLRYTLQNLSFEQIVNLTQEITHE
jgi:two-component system, chemotaxis family, sensor kinase Cph1